MKKSRVIITGGSGFIGKSLIRRLSEDYKCIILGRQKRKVLKIDDSDFDYLQTDYSNNHLESVLTDTDRLVHLAAVRPGPDDNFDYYLPNIYFSSNIFNACASCGIKNIVALSSRMVYSEINTIPYSEGQYISPSSYYGISKAGMELLVEYCNRYLDMRIKCLRTAIVLGAEERKGSLHMDFIFKAIKKEPLLIYGSGKEKREYIYVKDVAGAIIDSLRHPEINGIFNIGSGKSISNLEIAEMINKVFGNAGNISFMNNKYKEKPQSLMDIRKAEKLLGWRPEWTIRDCLADLRDELDKK